MFCAGMFGALKPGFRSLATLKLVMNAVGEQFIPKRTAAASRGFLATAQLSYLLDFGINRKRVCNSY